MILCLSVVCCFLLLSHSCLDWKSDRLAPDLVLLTIMWWRFSVCIISLQSSLIMLFSYSKIFCDTLFWPNTSHGPYSVFFQFFALWSPSVPLYFLVHAFAPSWIPPFSTTHSLFVIPICLWTSWRYSFCLFSFLCPASSPIEIRPR